MSDQYRKINCYVNAATLALVDAAGYSLSRKEEYPRLVYNDRCEIAVHFLAVSANHEVAAQPLPTNLSFVILGDCEYELDQALMFKTAGALESSSPENGILHFRINSSSTRFREMVSGDPRRSYEMVILGLPPGETEAGVLAKIPFLAENRISETGAVELPEENEYLTAVEVRSLFRGKPELRFASGDGEYHAEQSVDDRCFAFRNAGGEWSDPVTLPTGNFSNGGLVAVYDPAFEFVRLLDNEPCYQLDSTTPSMLGGQYLWNAKSVQLLIESADPEVTGSIVLIPDFDGTELERVTIPIAATKTSFQFALSGSGVLSFRRDYVNEEDTLKSEGAVVGALIFSPIVWTEPGA